MAYIDISTDTENDVKKIPVIHLHIPKAAGTTLSLLFRKLFSPEETFICGSNETGLNHYDSNIYFINLEDEQKIKYKFIGGHVEFALIKSYPAQHFSFTMLRNPVSRINSMYYYIKQNEKHHLHHVIMDNNLSLEQFCELGLWHEIDNGMCRRISGVADSVPYGRCTVEVLNAAKYNLENNISFVGIQERFNESLFLLLNFLDALDLLDYERRNTTKIKRHETEMSTSAKTALNKVNRYDLELYSYARQLYTSRYKETLATLQKPLASYLQATKQKQAR